MKNEHDSSALSGSAGIRCGNCMRLRRLRDAGGPDGSPLAPESTSEDSLPSSGELTRGTATRNIVLINLMLMVSVMVH